MPTPSLIIPSAPVYDEGLLYGLNVYGTNFVPEPIPFTRATTATRTNAAGLIELAPYNLALWSEQFTTANSYLLRQATTTTNTTETSAPNGTLTADKIFPDGSNNLHQILSNDAPNTISFNTGTTYTQSIYAKAGNGTQGQRIQMLFSSARFTSLPFANFNLQTGALGTIGGGASATITSIGNGWYRCTLTATCNSAGAGGGVFMGLITSDTAIREELFIGDTTNHIYVWGAQLVEGADPLPYLKTETRLNRPRVDFSLGGCPNLLLEPQRTNLALQSSSFDTTWTKVSVSVAANSTTSPSGVTDADTITSTTTSQALIVQLPTIVSGTNYTTSFYVKQNTQRFVYIRFTAQSVSDNYVSAVFDLQDGTVGQTAVGGTSGTLVGTKVETAANGFYRISLTASINITSANFGIGFAAAKTGNTFSNFGAIIDPITNGNSFFLWGAQLEAGAYPTTYIPTVATSVTRNADSFIQSNVFSRGMITAVGGTWFVELRNNVLGFRDTSSSGIFLSTDSLGNQNGFRIRNNSGTSARFTIDKIIAGARVGLFALITDNNKIAIKWDGTTADVFVNGVKVVSANSFTITAMEFVGALGNDNPKYINEMKLYPTPLTDTELISMTTI